MRISRWRDRESPDDVQLLRQMAETRDPEAFSQFYDRHARLVYSVAWRILRNDGDAEDVTQEVFMRVWEQAARYNPQQAPAGSWIVAIARNRAIDRIRSRGRREAKERPLSEDPQMMSVTPVAADPSPEEAVEAAESRQKIREALDSIPESQRQIIFLAYFEGLTHQEIASKLSEPLGTVKTRMRMGMLKLAELLKPYVGGRP